MKKCFRLSLILFALIHPMKPYAGEDLIFVSGFDLTEAELVCPDAPDMIKSTDMSGGVFYGINESIDPAGDIDYYRVPVASDEWYDIRSQTFQNDLNTVVSVFTGSGDQLLAWNDDALPFTSRDSGIIHRSTSTGSWCIKIEDVSTAENTAIMGGGTNDYSLVVIPMDFEATDTYNLDAEPNDNIAMAQMGLSTFIYDFNSFQEATYVSGVFDDNDDEDVYQISTPELTQSMSLVVMPSGVPGNGSSASMQTIEVLANNGTEVLARIEPQSDRVDLYLPALPQTDYYIRTGAPDSPDGSNSFYTFFWFTSASQNPQETNDANNDTSAGSEVATPIDNGNSTSYFLGGDMSGSNDVDWWAFEAEAGDTIGLFCASWQYGSGVRDLTVSVFDNPMNPALQTQIEDQIDGINWFDSPLATAPGVPVTTSGTHYLTVEASMFSPDVSERYYLCGIQVF